MSSIWSSSGTQIGTSPFEATGTSPTPGGGAAAKFQSILQSAVKASPGSHANASAGITAATDSTTGSSNSSDSDTTISANDFLTLLVTEMQNQDPTADTDPNAYIDQLVQINSLEQLISINQTLATVLGAASTPSGGSGAFDPVASGTTPKSNASSKLGSAEATQDRTAKPNPSRALPARSPTALNRLDKVQGNLSAPRGAPAAQTVAHALDGHPRAAPHGHGIRDIPTRSLP